MQDISEGFNQYLSKFDSFISIGFFNAEMSNSHIQHFCAVFNLKKLFEKASCFKNLERPTGIDQILTNYTKLLYNFVTFKASLFDYTSTCTVL